MITVRVAWNASMNPALTFFATDRDKKGQRYLTVLCDHFTGRVVWAAKGCSNTVVGDSQSPTTSFSNQAPP